MTHVFLILDEAGQVITVYDSIELAEKMKKPIEDKLNKKVSIEKRSINLDIKTIGVLK